MSQSSETRSRIWRKRCWGTLLLLASLLFVELAATVYFRVTHTGRGVTFDPNYGWRHLPGIAKSGFFWGANEPATTNSHGWRDAETSYAKPEGMRRIVVVGDSFTFGVRVDYGQRFTEMLEDELEATEVINLGANAFGTDQELLVLRHEGLRYEPDVVLLVAFLGNDLADIRHERKNYWPKPHFVLDADDLILSPPVKSWDVRLRGSTYVGEGLFRLVQRWIPEHTIADDAPGEPANGELFVRLIEEAHRTATEAGAEFRCVLVYSRRPNALEAPQPFPPEQHARELLFETDVPLLDTWDLYRDRVRAGEDLYPADDEHWNEAGHRVLAEALLQLLR